MGNTKIRCLNVEYLTIEELGTYVTFCPNPRKNQVGWTKFNLSSKGLNKK